MKKEVVKYVAFLLLVVGTNVSYAKDIYSNTTYKKSLQ